MNLLAFYETYKNREHIKTRPWRDYTLVNVDTDRVEFHGIPWKKLGDWGKRKFENQLVLSSKDRLKIRYI